MRKLEIKKIFERRFWLVGGTVEIKICMTSKGSWKRRSTDYQQYQSKNSKCRKMMELALATQIYFSRLLYRLWWWCLSYIITPYIFCGLQPPVIYDMAGGHWMDSSSVFCFLFQSDVCWDLLKCIKWAAINYYLLSMCEQRFTSQNLFKL